MMIFYARNRHNEDFRNRKNPKSNKESIPDHKTYHKIIWSYIKQFSEVTECQRCISFESEVAIVMSWGNITAFTGK